ncbi:hypothetical protein AB0F17_51750 [Nonomuraea sp. NPDC026600]|uniref:hypothetical protein n=1 Tax=Nonomuraea sp. NPDC026600 TaxID=3155363 RepID=UPI0033F85DF0
MDVDWQQPGRSPDDRCRVIAWTCACHESETVYELCESGGLAFLRRIIRGTSIIVEESHRTPRAEALQMWALLLNGCLQ